MNTDKLLYQANQLTGFFGSYPEIDAAQGIADHLKAFWTPAMCGALSKRLAANPEGANPLVLLAIRLPPLVGPDDAPVGESPIAKTVEGPKSLGQLASDAG
jgi:formate dehydrogenase subunit delta